MADADETNIKHKKAHCSRCEGTRNCDIKGHHIDKGDDDFHWWRTDWYILQCRGCENTFVQTVDTNSEDFDHDYGPDGETISWPIEAIKYWPALSKRKKPEWLAEFWLRSQDVNALSDSLDELYGALDNDLHMLAAIGIRTSFDISAELLGIDPEKPFVAKLDGLVTSGHIRESERARLQDLVDAGSASAHRGWRPTPNDLSTMMDVLEHFVQDAFIAPARKAHLDARIKQVSEKVPPRKRKQKAQSKSQI